MQTGQAEDDSLEAGDLQRDRQEVDPEELDAGKQGHDGAGDQHGGAGEGDEHQVADAIAGEQLRLGGGLAVLFHLKTPPLNGLKINGDIQGFQARR